MQRPGVLCWGWRVEREGES